MTTHELTAAIDQPHAADVSSPDLCALDKTFITMEALDALSNVIDADFPGLSIKGEKLQELILSIATDKIAHGEVESDGSVLIHRNDLAAFIEAGSAQ